MDGLALEHTHAVEDAGDQPFNDLWVVVGEVGPRRPHVGDEFVSLGGRGQDARALHLLRNFVDVGRPGDTGVNAAIGDEGGSGLEGGSGELVFDRSRLDAGVEQQVIDEVLRGAVLGVHDGLALQV